MYKGTKRQIGQSIQDYLANGTSSSEVIVDIRDIYVVLDRITNKYAKMGLFANMQMGDRNVGDCYMVTFESVKIHKDRRRVNAFQFYLQGLWTCQMGEVLMRYIHKETDQKH